MLNDFFREKGFEIKRCSDVGSLNDNFDLLNVHPWFPARTYLDVCFLSKEKILKKHNTGQIYKYLCSEALPIKIAFIGRTYRKTKESCCSDSITFQYDGIIVDESVSLVYGKQLIEEIIINVLGIKRIRTVIKFFPYADPGFMLQGECPVCLGEGCPHCDGSGYLNLCAYGILHQNLLPLSNLHEHKNILGFTFCFNLSKITLIKYKLHDVHDLFFL
jgi:phenylalanyl-tRNA synthetase alpha subunit